MASARRQEEKEWETKVTDWWNGDGHRMWNEALRNQLPGGFLGEDVQVIRYQQYGEWHMPFVIIQQRARHGVVEFEATVGGLIGRREDDSEPAVINTFSQTTVRGASTAEVLYKIVH